MESIFNKNIKTVSDNLSVSFSDLTFDNLLKNYLFLSYFDEFHDYPLEMMDAEILLDEYLNLLENQLLIKPKETWIVLNNPDSFISKKELEKLLVGFQQISKKTGLLKVYFISNTPPKVKLSCEDIPKTIILADEAHQMPDFDAFRKNIESYYPTELPMSDLELCQSFYKIVTDIGIEDKKTRKISRNMVLLKVIDEILGYDFRVSFENSELSELEKTYLLTKN